MPAGKYYGLAICVQSNYKQYLPPNNSVRNIATQFGRSITAHCGEA